jgi:ketosteroid isomerase-like protein
MDNLLELTNKYIDLFSAKDINGIADMLSEGFILQDPVVKRIEGKNLGLVEIEKIFKGCKHINFSAKNIYVHNNTTLIEFNLKIDDVALEGVDIIEWRDNKIVELRAYLDV